MRSVREEAVLRRVDGLAGEMLQFLREFIAIPTVNPPGDNYVPCAHFLGRTLDRFGYRTRFVEAEGRPENTRAHPRLNVIGRLDGVAPRPLVHFNGHMDVVPAGDGWTVHPFGGVVRDGRIYGRGTSDQKAGIAASIFAVEAIRREGIALHGSIEQSGSVDEESGGFAGVAYLAQQGLIHRDVTDYVIITEPLNVDRICLGHRGVYWFAVTTHGRIAHGSMPFQGVSAISKMSDFVHALEHELAPKLRLRTTAMPVEPREARRPSLNINAISGGQPDGGIQTPCVADRCHAIFDRRFLIEESFVQVKGEIQELLEELRRRDSHFRYDLEDLMTVHPVQTDADSTLVGAMTASVKDALGIANVPLIASPGTYDQKHVMRMGMVDQCIAYGPGTLNQAHQPDEYCEVDHLIQAAKAMALAAMRLAGEA